MALCKTAKKFLLIGAIALLDTTEISVGGIDLLDTAELFAQVATPTLNDCKNLRSVSVLLHNA